MVIHVTVKGQIVIPAELPRKYGIKAGTKINVIDTGEAILLKPVNEESLKRLQRMLKGKGVLKTMLEERGESRTQLDHQPHEHLAHLDQLIHADVLVHAVSALKSACTVHDPRDAMLAGPVCITQG